MTERYFIYRTDTEVRGRSLHTDTDWSEDTSLRSHRAENIWLKQKKDLKVPDFLICKLTLAVKDCVSCVWPPVAVIAGYLYLSSSIGELE